MITKELRSGLSYVESRGTHDPRQPKEIAGNRDIFVNACRLLRSEKKYVHIVLGYHADDNPTEEMMREDVAALIKQLAPDTNAQDIAFVAIAHKEPHGDQIGDPVAAREKSHRKSVHVLIALVDLFSGKALQIYHAPVHRAPLRAWTIKQNKKQGYTCSSEPKRWKKKKELPTQEQLDCFAEELKSETDSALAKTASLTPESWAIALRNVAMDARLEISDCQGKLTAKVTLPGMYGATALTVLPTGLSTVRPAQIGKQRRKQKIPPQPADSERQNTRDTASRKQVPDDFDPLQPMSVVQLRHGNAPKEESQLPFQPG